MRNTKVTKASATTSSSRTAKKPVVATRTSSRVATKPALKTPAKTPVKNATKVTRTPKETSMQQNDFFTTAKAVKKITTPERRHAMISEAAYYIAERYGFNPDLSFWCWLEAEKKIDAQLLAI